MEQICKKKPTLAFFELSSCKGCEMQILNANLELLDILKQVEIVYWPTLSSNDVPASIDISLVEGAIKTSDEEEFVKTLRDSSKTVIALGACACGVSHEMEEKQKKYRPISDVIEVDHYVRCCPVDTSNFIDVLQKAIGGRNTFVSTATLCGECKSNEKGCFYGRGKLCAGLVSRCGCDSLCTKLNMPCRGCSGTSPNSCMETATQLASSINSDTSLQDFISVCDVQRFLDKNLDGLDGEDAVFVASRFDGKSSFACAFCAIEANEEKHGTFVSDYVANLRGALKLAERAHNHLNTLIFQDLRCIKQYEDIQQFVDEENEFIVKALELKEALTNVLTSIAGRAVHPITCVEGGFSVEISDEVLHTVSQQLRETESFAISLIDIFAKCWQKSQLGDDVIALSRVLDGWDDLTDVARFGAAKASLRPPENDTRKECIARSIEIVDAIERIKNLLDKKN